jgi:hypothetical protein
MVILLATRFRSDWTISQAPDASYHWEQQDQYKGAQLNKINKF